MSITLSNDLRKRVVFLLQRKKRTYSNVADAFGIGVASVNRIWRKYRETGSYKRKITNGRVRSLITVEEEAQFQRMVEQYSHETFDE